MSGAGVQALCRRIDALSLRERAMVLLAALVLIGFIGDALWLAPQRARLALAQREAAEVRALLAKHDRQLAELRVQGGRDPDEVPRLRLQQLTAELAAFNAQFARLERSLVAPARMAPLLEQVLKRTAGVTVVQVQSLPVRVLSARDGAAVAGDAAGGTPASVPESGAGTAGSTDGPAPVAAARAAEAGGTALYRHGVELTVRGSYRDLLQYVQNVEQLPVRVQFGKAVLDASRWPEVDLRLTVYTLSMDRSWLAL